MLLAYLKTMAPYMLRPMMWPEFRRQLVRRLEARLFGSGTDPAAKAAEKRAGEAWCVARAVDSSEALQRLGIGTPLVDIERRFAPVMTAARDRAATCPMKLGGPGNLDLLYSLCEAIEARRVVETGVAYGWSSLVILLSLKNRPDARLFSVDLPYLKYRNDRWVGIAIPDDLRPIWKLYRMADREGLPRALRAAGPVDLAHYDSDKSPEGRHFAYPRMWRSLRPGGTFVSDDVGDNTAFRYFCAEVGLEPVIVRGGNKYQGVLVKPNA
jgi:predicted O-methyltransferase YrrM